MMDVCLLTIAVLSIIGNIILACLWLMAAEDRDLYQQQWNAACQAHIEAEQWLSQIEAFVSSRGKHPRLNV